MPLQEWWSEVQEFLLNLRPGLIKIVIAALILLVGTLVCGYLERWSRKAAQAALDRAGRGDAPAGTRGVGEVAATQLAHSLPLLVGRFVYWLAFLLFGAGAVEALGLPVATRTGERLALYLPGAFTGVVIVLVGIVVASLAGGIASAWAAANGTSYAGAIGRTVQGLLLLLATLLGLEQIGIHGEMLVILLAIVLGVILGGAALAFGLGARTAVSNIVGSYYVAQTYRVGQTVRVGEFEGRIVRTTATAVVLDNRGGQVLVPARLFTEQPSMLLPEIN